MRKIDDGGPAFPIADPEMTIEGQSVKETQGMSLRDYFAGQAVGRLLGVQSLEIALASTEQVMKAVSAAAYKVADAMIAEKRRTEASNG